MHLRKFFVSLSKIYDAKINILRIQTKHFANYFLKMRNFFRIMNKKDIVLSLVNHFADGNKTLFANKLGVKPQTISTWISRDTLDIDKIFANCDGLNAEWLLTGDGNMLKTDSASENNNKIYQLPDNCEDGMYIGFAV